MSPPPWPSPDWSCNRPQPSRIHGIVRAQDDAVRGDGDRIHEIEMNPSISQSGDTIRISVPRDEWQRRHLSISYELVVPPQTRLRAYPGSGSESVEGIHGPAELETGSGSVTVARVDDEVRIQTGSGRIQLDSLKSKVDAHTGSGSVRLEQTAAGPTVRCA